MFKKICSVLLLALTLPMILNTQLVSVYTENKNKTTGKVQSIQKNVLSVKDKNNEIKVFVIDENAVITKDRVNSSLQDIKPEDQVTVTRDDQGKVVVLDFIPKDDLYIRDLLIPGLILLLLLASIILLLQRRSGKHVKTTKS